MRTLLLAGVISSFFLMVPLDAGAEEQEVRMDVAELRGGAVPRVRVAGSQHMRRAAFYARTADGMVQPIYFKGRLSVDGAGPLLHIPAGEEHLIPIGGTPGLFAAARTGLKRDREAIIVLLARGSSVAHDAASLPEEASVSADIFFRQAARRHRGEFHLLPYEIMAAGLLPEISQQREASEVALTFEGVEAETVFMIADILAVEGNGPLMPLVINKPETSGIISFKYWSEASARDFRDRLQKIIKGLGLSGARIVDHEGDTRFTISALKR